MRSIVIASSPKTDLNSSLYAACAEREATTALGSACISLSASIGAEACSSSVAARPSQKKVLRCAMLRSVGELRAPAERAWPNEVARPSLQPSCGSWQLAQAIAPEPERRGSKKRRLPSSDLASV